MKQMGDNSTSVHQLQNEECDNTALWIGHMFWFNCKEEIMTCSPNHNATDTCVKLGRNLTEISEFFE